MPRLFLLIVLLLLPLWAQAQVLVRGLVRDSETGVTLAAAHVVVDGTDQGTITNREGRFEIVVEALPVVLRVRYIGYQTQRVRLGPNDPRVSGSPCSSQYSR